MPLSFLLLLHPDLPALVLFLEKLDGNQLEYVLPAFNR